MSDIPYVFVPIPHELLTDDFLEDPIMMRLIRCIFSRLRTYQHEETFKNNGKVRKVLLEPFEFIYGLEKTAKACGISERNLRTRIDNLIELNYVKKVTSRSTSTYSVYILVTASFKQIIDKQVDSQSDKQVDKQIDNKAEAKKQRSKKHAADESLPALLEKIQANDPEFDETFIMEQYKIYGIEIIKQALGEFHDKKLKKKKILNPKGLFVKMCADIKLEVICPI